ncbi:unnamed protein product [Effrenium voratum]|uniref:Uncharacterized protein n=1 Tax=Effrenium voratum TaxID=2562239 RepID=A0AA36MPG6_9DINO|nr:unnamed protein product [Effrenium voratum]
MAPCTPRRRLTVDEELSDWSACRTLSAPSSWSPARSCAESGAERSAPSPGRGSGGRGRRSISELSLLARMTPENLKLRGLGLPWRGGSAGGAGAGGGLCRADIGGEGRRICLIPTPELNRRSSRAPRSPRSPRSPVRAFAARVREASLCLSPDSDELTSPLFSPTRCSELRGFQPVAPAKQIDRSIISGPQVKVRRCDGGMSVTCPRR